MFVDTHIHISHRLFDGEVPCIVDCKDNIRVTHYTRDALISELKKANIEFVIEPAIEIESNEKLLEIAYTYPGFILPAVGVHPTRTAQTGWSKRKIISELSQDERIVAIGELGLDYHHDRKKQHRFIQKMWFIWQIKLAHKRRLPLILHIRQADDDAIKILRRHKKKLHGGVCHCFNQGIDIARIYTEEFGLMLGIGGSLLQSESEKLVEVVKLIPLEYIVLETDGPYVKPDKTDNLSGKQWQKARNTSLIIKDVAAKIASIKGITVDEVERVTTENAKKIFGV